MFARDLRVLLATIAVFTFMVAILEGVVRAVRARPPSVAAERTHVAVLLVVAMTAAMGLALLMGEGTVPKSGYT